MPRPIWNGKITFGLVNIPIVLYSAEEPDEIHFNLIDRRNGARIRYQRINEKTGKEVPWEEISRGYEYNDHDYILLKDADLKSIAKENARAIDIQQFVPQSSIDPLEFFKPYYLLPEKNGEKGYVILRETLHASKKIGITKVVIHTHQYLAALLPHKNALVLNLLRYPSEIKKMKEFDFPDLGLKKYKINKKELEIAEQLINSMTSKWHPEQYRNEYQAILKAWIKNKIKKRPKRKVSEKTTTPVSDNVIDFVGLLKKSLQEKKRKSR